MRRRGRKTKAEQEAYEKELVLAYAFYEQGHTLTEVAERFGWGHPDSARSAFWRRGWPVRSTSETYQQRWTPERVSLLKSLLAEGRYFTEIALILGVSAATLRRKARELRLSQAPRPIPHGTTNGYRRNCRCEKCKRASAQEMARRIRENKRNRVEPPVHGTPTAYQYYGCRCDACTEANTRAGRPYARAYYQRKKAQGVAS